MDTPKKPAPRQLLDDLESIRQALAEQNGAPSERATDADDIPVLFDVVTEPIPAPFIPETPRISAEQRLRAEMPQLINQLLEDFLPVLEQELRQRIEQRLVQLTPSEKP